MQRRQRKCPYSQRRPRVRARILRTLDARPTRSTNNRRHSRPIYIRYNHNYPMRRSSRRSSRRGTTRRTRFLARNKRSRIHMLMQRRYTLHIRAKRRSLATSTTNPSHSRHLLSIMSSALQINTQIRRDHRTYRLMNIRRTRRMNQSHNHYTASRRSRRRPSTRTHSRRRPRRHDTSRCYQSRIKLRRRRNTCRTDYSRRPRRYTHFK